MHFRGAAEAYTRLRFYRPGHETDRLAAPAEFEVFERPFFAADVGGGVEDFGVRVADEAEQDSRVADQRADEIAGVLGGGGVGIRRSPQELRGRLSVDQTEMTRMVRSSSDTSK